MAAVTPINKNQTSTVHVDEHIGFRVRRFLGETLAGSHAVGHYTGDAKTSFLIDIDFIKQGLSIVEEPKKSAPPQPIPKKNWLMILIDAMIGSINAPKRSWVATLYYDKHSTRTDIGRTHWLLEVYGGSNVEPMTKLAELLLAQFHPDTIDVVLVQEEPKQETNYKETCEMNRPRMGCGGGGF